MYTGSEPWTYSKATNTLYAITTNSPDQKLLIIDADTLEIKKAILMNNIVDSYNKLVGTVAPNETFTSSSK